MKTTSSELLEFDALKALLGRYLASPLGRTELDRVAPRTERDWIEATLAEVAEAIEYTRTEERIRFDSLADVTVPLATLRIDGAILEGRQILELTNLLERAGEARAQLSAASARFPRIASHAAAISDFRPLLRDVSGKILPDGSVADNASVALAKLRRNIEKQQKHIQDSLDRFMRAHREDGTLQEEFITIRNERFVVPVVAGQRRKVDGVIHGSSSTGRTLFVEPLETIDLNNQLVRLNEEEQREVARILAELTAKLSGSAPAIAKAAAVMGELEMLFAKAHFAIEFACVIPSFADRLRLDCARHPLLEDILRRQNKPIVPISLALGGTERTLLISGPNTGGKTVSLKTAGLLTLMAHAGLPVPCAAGEFPLVAQVLADIGDNQSIAESLSTFSAHIARIREMLEGVTADSLVLLDELGRATDPEEGGALGVAILESFGRAGALTLASTHLLALKIYGANTPGVVNGSMGFNEQTLEPTYELRLGAPGKSAGLDIASRLGLSPALIERARSAMSSSERDIAAFLSELHERLAGIAREREQLAEHERVLESDWEKREAARIKEFEERSAALVERFEQQARKIIAQIEQPKAAAQAQAKVAKTSREFLEQTAPRAARVIERRQPQIEEGSRVRVHGLREVARVRRLIGDHLVEVEAGTMKLQVPAGDIEEVLPESAVKHGPGVSGPKWDISVREINVIGQRAEEACDLVDKFLDDAVLGSIDRVRVIHGHGMGILKKAIAGLLGGHPHVERFYPATPSEGGAGATIVELRH